MNNDYLDPLLDRARSLEQQVRERLGSMSAGQLNWKPARAQWSIAQCLEHVVIANRQYFPILVQIADGTRKVRRREKVPVLPQIWGSMLVQGMKGGPARKIKTSEELEPSDMQIPPSIVGIFCDNLGVFTDLVNKTRNVDHRHTIVTSPASGLVTYSLHDCCTMLVYHSERHCRQALEVAAHPEFPAQ
ncbi:MAG: hypothetical protein OHK0039_29000 [Bacteroidia bacterium]